MSDETHTNDEFSDATYDNDEAMAALGRTLVDMLAGQREKAISDERIGLALIKTIDDSIDEDALDEQEREGSCDCGRAKVNCATADDPEADHGDRS